MIMNKNPFPLQLRLLSKAGSPLNADQILEKGRGEDARTLFNGRSADQYNEKKYPTGKMIQSRSGKGPWRAGYRGVFGENRNLLVDATSMIPRKTKNPSEWYAEPDDRQEHQRRIDPPIDPHIEWIHIKPGTVVEPHHVEEVFRALYDAGFTGPNLTYTPIPDPDEVDNEEAYHPDPDVGYHPDPGTSVRPPRQLRRDRLFRPWVKKWKEFVASQPPAPYIDTTQPAGDREDEDPWEGMKEFHEPEVNLQWEIDQHYGGDGQHRSDINKAISTRLKMRKSGNDIIHSFDENDPLNWRQPDFTDQYNTELNPEQEAAYQKWLSIQKVPTSTRDYDLRGFFADQVFGKTDNSEHEGHFDDRWKKPNHMTFSDQSNYAEILPDGSSTGGRWIEHLSSENDPKGLGHYTFAMSPHQKIPEQAMREYFQREESHNSFFDPKTHVIHEGEIPLIDQHVDHLIQEGVAYPSLFGLQKVNNVRNLAPNLQTIRGVRLGGETNGMSSAPVIKPNSPDMPVVPQTGTTLKTPKAPSLKGPGGLTTPPVLAGPGGFTPRPASTGPGGFTPPSPFPSADSTKKSFFFLNTQEKTITDICMERLGKALGNPEDVIHLGVPLLIRLLEYAREDAKDDMDLHDAAEKMIELSKEGHVLHMKDYKNIIR